jgi:hypothetical protein
LEARAKGGGTLIARAPPVSTQRAIAVGLTLVVVAAAVGAGCHPRDEDPSPAEIAACERFAAASVAVAPSYCLSGPVPPAVEAVLVKQAQDACLAVLARHNTGRSEATVTACAAALEQVPCGAGTPDACAIESVPPGPGAEGAPCSSFDQCASLSCENLEIEPQQCGHCGALGHEGQECGPMLQPCPVAMGCSGATYYVHGTCEKTALKNTTGMDEPCDERLGPHCSDGVCTRGRCWLSTGHLGEPCTPSLDDSCTDGLFCPDIGRCTMRGASGSPCTEPYSNPCAAGLHCGTSGTCSTGAPVGSACKASYDCAGDASCSAFPSGICTAALELGMPCRETTVTCVAGAICGESSGVCVVADERNVWPGEPCNDETKTRCVLGQCTGTTVKDNVTTRRPGTCPPLGAVPNTSPPPGSCP